MEHHETTAPMISEFWTGHVTGGSRGRLTFRFRRGTVDDCPSTAVFLDQRFGRSVIESDGRLANGVLELRMRRFQGAAPFLPLDGALSLRLQQERAEGIWNTDLGTFGDVILRPSHITPLRWWMMLKWYRCATTVQRLVPGAYLTALVTLSLLSSLHILGIELTLPALILLLVPSPFLLRSMFARMVNSLKEMGLEQFWLIRFLQPKPQAPTAPFPAMGSDRPLFQDLTFRFVPATKHLLRWLALRGTVTLEDFVERAKTFAVTGDNLSATVGILRGSGCVEVDSERISILPLGLEYIQFYFNGTGAAL